MNHQSPALIIAQKPFGESKILLTAFTEDYGKVTGLIRRPRDLLKKPALSVGCFGLLSWREKESSSLPWLVMEDFTALHAPYLYEPLQLLQIQSLCALLHLALPDREAHPVLFEETIQLLHILKLEYYIAWEHDFLKELGFELVWDRCAVTGGTEQLNYLSPRTGRAVSQEAAQPYISKLIPMPQTLASELHVIGQFMEVWLFSERKAEKRLPLPRRQLYLAVQESCRTPAPESCVM